MFTTRHISAQNSGFIGKRNIISVDGRLFSPAFYNIFNNEDDYRKATDGTNNFKDSRNLLTYGMNFTLGRTVSNRVAFLLQGSFLRYKTVLHPFNASGTLQSKNVLKSTFFRNQSVGIMPIIEFTNSGGIVPFGLSNQIGFGIYTNKPLKDDYLILTQGFPEVTYHDEDKLFDYDTYKIRSYSLMYKINLRLPITRSLLFNIGFRYNLNITKFAAFFDNKSDEFGFALADYRDQVRRAQITNFVSMETGLSFVF